MNGDLKLTAAGANLIKHFEGCHKRVGPDRYQAYVCPAGVLTIGFGITRADKYKFGPNTIWSMADCDEAFVDSMREYEAAVHRMVTVALQPWQYDALVSFCFNCGPGNLQKSTLLRKLNAGDYAGAALEFHRWNKGGGKVLNGLVRRRASEALLFQNIADANYDGEPDVIEPMAEPMAQRVDQPGGKS
jgi:lysozyme